jgi:hypothetical protein
MERDSGSVTAAVHECRSAEGRSRASGRLVLVPSESLRGPAGDAPNPSVSGSGVPLGGSGETAHETEYGRAMDTRTIAIVALVIAVAIVVILFVL